MNGAKARKKTERSITSKPTVTTTKTSPTDSTTLDSAKTDRTIQSNTESNDSHGDPKAKALRAQVFAQWLIDQDFFGRDGTDFVLDVAGGKGQLSMELAFQAQVPCTVMDPLIRRRPPKSAWKRLQKHGAPLPQFLAQPFELNSAFCQEIQDPKSGHSASSFEEDQQSSLGKNYTLLCGLHPDECTEDILAVALQSRNMSVAIVPCCVFPSLFPDRRVGKDQRRVTTYNDFLQYLLAQDERLQKATLDFEGKNEVIYYNHRKTECTP